MMAIGHARRRLRRRRHRGRRRTLQAGRRRRWAGAAARRVVCSWHLQSRYLAGPDRNGARSLRTFDGQLNIGISSRRDAGTPSSSASERWAPRPLAELARRGRRVLGLEHFAAAARARVVAGRHADHPRGLLRASALRAAGAARLRGAGRRSSAATGARLLVPTGGLTIGPPDGRLVSGALASARTHGLAHDVLDATEVARRHPAVRLPGRRRRGRRAARRRAARRAGDRRAARRGARRRRRACATAWRSTGWEVGAAGVRVVVGGETLQADRLVLAGRSVDAALVPELAPTCGRAQRRPLVPAGAACGRRRRHSGPTRCPSWSSRTRPSISSTRCRRCARLGADLEDGVKFACHHSGVIAPLDAIDRQPSAADAAAIATRRRRATCPGSAPGRCARAVCCYTNTPDGHFLIDRHPDHHGRDPGQPVLGARLQVRPRGRRDRRRFGRRRERSRNARAVRVPRGIVPVQTDSWR